MAANIPRSWTLPQEPPVGTVVQIDGHGTAVFFKRIPEEDGYRPVPKRLDLPHGAVCWAARLAPEEFANIAWRTWGQILDRGPVTLVSEGGAS